MPTPSCPIGLDLRDGVVMLDEGFINDPHPVNQLLRGQHPVTRIQIPPEPPVWLITRYADVQAGLTEPRFAKDSAELVKIIRRAAGLSEDAPGLYLALHNHMLNSDPPKHTRLRKLVNKAFTGRAIAGLRPRIEQVATELADALAVKLATGGPADLVEDYAFPLPMTVICEILGVPDDRRSEFGAWSHAILSETSTDEKTVASIEMWSYLDELVAGKLADPGTDILSAILAPDEDANRLSQAEATSMASLLLVAGHETTVNLIGSGMLALLRDPRQLARLRADPALLSFAVEEFLRMDSPVNTGTPRFTTEPVSIGGTVIPAGEIVLLGLGSANRDPEQFDRPDELDVGRAKGGSLAFGHGIHYCLGAALARAEGEIAFRVLLDRLPDLSLAADPGELRWHNSILLRGLTRLPVHTRGATR